MRSRAVGVDGIAAFGHAVVQRVIAPVEAVLVGHRHDGGLLFGRVGAGSGHIRADLLGLVFVDGGEVEGRQQMDVGQPSGG